MHIVAMLLSLSNTRQIGWLLKMRLLVDNLKNNSRYAAISSSTKKA